VHFRFFRVALAFKKKGQIEKELLMGIVIYEKPPPSTDVEGWLQVLERKGLDQIRPEALVAAVQDLDLTGGKKVREAIAVHLSDVIYNIVAPRVRKTYPNQGKDVVEVVHGQILEAIFDRESADGKGLRKAFGFRIQLRLKDALRSESSAKKLGGVGRGADQAASAEGRSAEERDESPIDDAWLTNHEHFEVEDALMLIKDDLKRFAFRLYMNGMPCKSIDGDSIEKAVGRSERTVRTWIDDITKLLKKELGEVYE
jgi:hypothetical protein